MRSRARLVVAACVLCFGVLGLAQPAGAFIYWANFNGNQTIGRATLGGSAASHAFVTGERHPCGVAVDSAHLYWANLSGSTDGYPVPGATIGRSNLDGSAANQSFISGPFFPCGVAVDSAHVYWANTGLEGVIGGGTGTTIGRANLDGTGVDQAFISNANGPCGVAVDSTHVYWANRIGDSIGRANLDGTGAINNFITGANGPCGVAVDSGHVYWANTGYDPVVTPTYSGTTIGRANLDGTSPDQNFITGAGLGPFGVAVDSTHIYWASFFTPYAIGRANLDGSAPNPSLLISGSNPAGVAVDADPSVLFTFAAVKRDPKRGTAIVTLEVPGPGKVVLQGHKIKRVTEVVEAATEVTLPVKGEAAGRARLERTGKLKVDLKITYTPTGGEPATQHKKLTLKKR